MWRSLLFVPVLNHRLVKSATRCYADAIVLDLEAAVPEHRKEEARKVLLKAVSGLKKSGIDIAVRVNPLDLGGIDDIKVAIEITADLIVLPHATIDAAKMAADLAGDTRIVSLIESPRGVIDAIAIAEASSTIVGLGLGAEDYSTEMCARPTPELLVPAAFQVIQAARATRREPLVIPDTIAEYTDLKRFEKAALKARAMGASGSFAIHPGQVEVLNRVFMPSDEEILEAQDIIAVATKASQSGNAIATRNGQMIDKPIVSRARSIIELSRRFADMSEPVNKNRDNL